MNTPGSTPRWAHVTYASFRNVSGRGGWRAGPSVGADQSDQQLVAEYAPTSLVPTRPFDDFISASEIEALPRRFEYLPFADRALFMQSVPAGKDATGRPGNVFTHAVVDHDLDSPLAAVYPINLYRSPDLRTPFRMASVNAVELPADAAEPQVGPLADLAVAWMMVNDLLGDRTGALYRLQDALVSGSELPALVVKNPNEAAYWLQALSSTLSPVEARRLLRFSTFERAGSLPPQPGGTGRALIVAPLEDKKLLEQRSGVCVVDPADPATHAPEPTTPWSRLTSLIFTPGVNPAAIVAVLTRATADLSERQIDDLSPGDGLARLVREELIPVDGRMMANARQQLAGALGPSRVEAPDGKDEDLAAVRRVIGNPELARQTAAWPSLTPPAIPEEDYDQLADEAVDTLKGLRDAQVQTLVAYLDFLLHTGLMPPGNVTDPDFRATFSFFPALGEDWTDSVPDGAHPALESLLELAERDHRLREEARRAEEVRRRPEWTLRQLSAANSVRNIRAWLGKVETREKLRQLIDERVIENNDRDYTVDLLRVYYTIGILLELGANATGDRAHDLDLLDDISELTLTAVTRHAQEQEISLARFQQLGRQIAREDFPVAFRGPRSLAAARKWLEIHTDAGNFPFAPAIGKIFAAVARGIVAELDENRKDLN